MENCAINVRQRTGVVVSDRRRMKGQIIVCKKGADVSNTGC